MKVIEGKFESLDNKKIAIVVSRWNEFIVSKLLDGAIDALKRHDVSENNILVAYCPGAFEIPITAQRIVALNKYDVVIALGAVIRGATPHFDYIAAEVTKGLASVSLNTSIPCINGVLTTDSIEQAIERAGTKSGNKGFESAMTALEMLSLFNTFSNL